MQRIVIVTLCFVLFPAFAPAAVDQANYEKHEKVVKDLLAALTDLADALESVKDTSTAKTAAGKIENVCDRFEKLAEEAKKLAKLEAEEDKKLQATYLPQLQKQSERLQNVALQANVNSGGETTFVKALKRLEQVSKKLESIGKGL